MEVSDRSLVENRDWDPCYLKDIFDVDFNDSSELWINDIDDMELVKVANDVERYSPIVEDISMDDNELCKAVETIEEE